MTSSWFTLSTLKSIYLEFHCTLAQPTHYVQQQTDSTRFCSLLVSQRYVLGMSAYLNKFKIYRLLGDPCKDLQQLQTPRLFPSTSFRTTNVTKILSNALQTLSNCNCLYNINKRNFEDPNCFF